MEMSCEDGEPPGGTFTELLFGASQGDDGHMPDVLSPKRNVWFDLDLTHDLVSGGPGQQTGLAVDDIVHTRSGAEGTSVINANTGGHGIAHVPVSPASFPSPLPQPANLPQQPLLQSPLPLIKIPTHSPHPGIPPSPLRGHVSADSPMHPRAGMLSPAQFKLLTLSGQANSFALPAWNEKLIQPTAHTAYSRLSPPIQPLTSSVQPASVEEPNHEEVEKSMLDVLNDEEDSSLAKPLFNAIAAPPLMLSDARAVGTDSVAPPADSPPLSADVVMHEPRTGGGSPPRIEDSSRARASPSSCLSLQTVVLGPEPGFPEPREPSSAEHSAKDVQALQEMAASKGCNDESETVGANSASVGPDPLHVNVLHPQMACSTIAQELDGTIADAMCAVTGIFPAQKSPVGGEKMTCSSTLSAADVELKCMALGPSSQQPPESADYGCGGQAVAEAGHVAGDEDLEQSSTKGSLSEEPPGIIGTSLSGPLQAMCRTAECPRDTPLHGLSQMTVRTTEVSALAEVSDLTAMHTGHSPDVISTFGTRLTQPTGEVRNPMDSFPTLPELREAGDAIDTDSGILEMVADAPEALEGFNVRAPISSCGDTSQGMSRDGCGTAPTEGPGLRHMDTLAPPQVCRPDTQRPNRNFA